MRSQRHTPSGQRASARVWVRDLCARVVEIVRAVTRAAGLEPDEAVASPRGAGLGLELAGGGDHTQGVGDGGATAAPRSTPRSAGGPGWKNIGSSTRTSTSRVLGERRLAGILYG